MRQISVFPGSWITGDSDSQSRNKATKSEAFNSTCAVTRVIIFLQNAWSITHYPRLMNFFYIKLQGSLYEGYETEATTCNFVDALSVWALGPLRPSLSGLGRCYMTLHRMIRRAHLSLSKSIFTLERKIQSNHPLYSRDLNSFYIRRHLQFFLSYLVPFSRNTRSSNIWSGSKCASSVKWTYCQRFSMVLPCRGIRG